MDRSQKEQLVSNLHGAFSDANLVVITQQTGLTVAEVTSLRRNMLAAGASYKVTQNRLTRRALSGTKYEALEPMFTGPTAVAFSADPVAAAKVCVEFAKKNEKLTIVGGALGEKQLNSGQVMELAKLPSLDELRAKLVGIVQAPATKLAGVAQAPAATLARVISAYASKETAA